MKKLLILFLLLTSLSGFAQLQLPYSIKLVNPKPVDFFYYNTSGSPYTNTAQVISQVISAIRYRGQTFNVNGVEYWFGAGIADGNLVIKGGGLGDLISTNNLSDLTNFATARSNLGLGSLATQSGTFSGTSSGTNTGDNAVNSLYSGLVSNATHTGDATGATALTVVKINGVSMAGLGTGVLKNTTGTGVPSIALNSDLPAMTATVGGAVPTPPNNTTTFLRGDGTFAVPSATTFVNGNGLTFNTNKYDLGGNQTASVIINRNSNTFQITDGTLSFPAKLFFSSSSSVALTSGQLASSGQGAEAVVTNTSAGFNSYDYPHSGSYVSSSGHHGFTSTNLTTSKLTSVLFDESGMSFQNNAVGGVFSVGPFNNTTFKGIRYDQHYDNSVLDQYSVMDRQYNDTYLFGAPFDNGLLPYSPSFGDIPMFNGSGWQPVYYYNIVGVPTDALITAPGVTENGKVISWNNTSGQFEFALAGSGSVTSVDISLPSFLSVTGNPITTNGTLAVTLNTQSANKIFGGPASGSAAAPTFRDAVAADLAPALNVSRTLTTAGSVAQSDNLHTIYLNSSSPFNLTVNTLTDESFVNLMNTGTAAVTIVSGTATVTGTPVIPAGGTGTIQYESPTNALVLVSSANAIPSTQVITTGSSGTVSATTTGVLFNPASLLSTYTLTMPAAPTDGFEVNIMFGGTIAASATVVTALTISPNSGQSILQTITPSTGKGGDVIRYRYVTSTTTWFRIL